MLKQNYLNNVSFLDRVLLAVEGHRAPVLPLFLQRRWLGADHLPVHVQHLEILLLDLNDHADRLRVDLFKK